MPGESVTADGLLHADEIRSIMPWDFPVLKGLIRVALDTLGPARSKPRRFMPVLIQIIQQLTNNLWYHPYGSNCGLRPFEQFDESTRAMVIAFTNAMDGAMLELIDMAIELYIYFLVARNDPRLSPVFDPDYTFDFMEARLKDAWTLFQEA